MTDIIVSIPQECPITGNGLCDSHGHCAYDETAGVSHCFCNRGFGGDDCSEVGHHRVRKFPYLN
jgi:hypothetical protein